MAGDIVQDPPVCDYYVSVISLDANKYYGKHTIQYMYKSRNNKIPIRDSNTN